MVRLFRANKLVDGSQIPFGCLFSFSILKNLCCWVSPNLLGLIYISAIDNSIAIYFRGALFGLSLFPAKSFLVLGKY